MYVLQLTKQLYKKLKITDMEQLELDNVQESTQKTESKNQSLIEYTQIAGTPFTIVTNTEKGTSFVAMGNNRLSEEISWQECKDLIDFRSWEIIFQMAACLCSKIIDEKLNNNN